jgi:outer membrane protein assembly factor BamA
MSPDLKVLRKSQDSLGCAQKIALITRKKAEKGFLEFLIDSVGKSADTLNLRVFQGPPYQIRSLKFTHLNETYAERSGLSKMAKKKGALNAYHLKSQMKECLGSYQNEGYPFARFDSLEVVFKKECDTVWADLSYVLNPGKLVTIDTVFVLGDIREHDAFVCRLAGIYPGEVFDQSQIDQARRLLNGSIYFKDVKSPKVEFVGDDKAQVTLSLSSRKSGKFDLLFGLLPPRQEGDRLEFTGLVDLQLVSPLFRAGEIIQFRYDKLMGSSQKMHLQYAHPYMFGSPIRIQGEFDLLKQDTTFLTRWGRFSAAYSITPNLALEVFYKGRRSSLISTRAFEADSTRIPPVLDGKDQTYGLGFEFENLDYRFNPRKGWKISADIGIGQKQVLKNPRLAEQLYQGLQTSLGRKELDLQLDWYRGYGKRWVLRLANRTYWLDQPQYFQNDLLQVGGSRTLRGFNENEFFADFMTLFTMENRFILEENSYLFVFSDYAYLENQSGLNRVLRPWGLGLGMTYETRAGMLSVTYASGQVGDQTFQPARGRIHIGIVNQF